MRCDVASDSPCRRLALRMVEEQKSVSPEIEYVCTASDVLDAIEYRRIYSLNKKSMLQTSAARLHARTNTEVEFSARSSVKSDEAVQEGAVSRAQTGRTTTCCPSVFHKTAVAV